MLALLIISIGVYQTWDETSGPSALRRRAHQIMNDAYLVCNSTTPQDPAQLAAIGQAEEAIHGLDLELSETQTLLAEFSNQLELRGCGMSANYLREHQPKRRQKAPARSGSGL
jgi:hypothetical protein